MAECSIAERKINSLEECLKVFHMEWLLEQLDTSLEQVRRNMKTEKEHLDVLKSAEKNLLKLSQIHDPDAAIRDKKSDLEIANAQNLQVALEATRTALRDLTKSFLEDIHLYYKYEFFAKMDISTLTNEKKMDLQMDRVLKRIDFISQLKRVNIVGKIRNFLQESRKCLRSYLEGNKDEFDWYRDRALHCLKRCIFGFYGVSSMSQFAVEGWEKDENMKSVMQKIYHQSRRHLDILEELERAAKLSLGGTLQIFSVYEIDDTFDDYFVAPFVLYINVMLMCTSVVNRKSGFGGFWNRVKIFFSREKTDKPPQLNNQPALLLKAYHLASYFINKNQYKSEVKIILREKNQAATSGTIIKEFKDAVEEIEQFLEAQFDINTYKEGKRNHEIWYERNHTGIRTRLPISESMCCNLLKEANN